MKSFGNCLICCVKLKKILMRNLGICIMIVFISLFEISCEDAKENDPIDNYEMIKVEMTVAELLNKRYYLFEAQKDIVYTLDRECELKEVDLQENATGGFDTLYYFHEYYQEITLDTTESDILYQFDKLNDVYWGQDQNQEIEVTVPMGTFFQLTTESWHITTHIDIKVRDINGEYISSDYQVTCDYIHWKPIDVEIISYY